MKKIILYCIVGLLCFGIGWSIKYFDLLSYFSSTSEINLISEKLKDFGDISKGSTASYYFKFENAGKGDLIIENVDTRCGCTVSGWNKNPIKPGQKDSILVDYDTNILGPFNRTILIYSNDNHVPLNVYIRGFVQDSVN